MPCHRHVHCQKGRSSKSGVGAPICCQGTPALDKEVSSSTHMRREEIGQILNHRSEQPRIYRQVFLE